MTKKYQLGCTVTLQKYTPWITEAFVEVEGDTREELEAQVEELENLDVDALATRLLGEDWWDDKYGWSYSDSEQLELTNLYDEPPRYDWDEIDGVMEEPLEMNDDMADTDAIASAGMGTDEDYQ